MPGYDSWKTRSPDDDLASPEEPSYEQQKADWEDQMQQTERATMADWINSNAGLIVAAFVVVFLILLAFQRSKGGPV